MGLSVFSSSSEGYVLLSSLSDGNHQVFVGFPRNEFPEEEFSLTLSGQNEGYLLKYLNNRWVMMNIETLSLTEGAVSAPPKPEAEQLDSDAFSVLLADVVGDSSILKTNVTEQESVKTEKAPVAEAEKPDSLNKEAVAVAEEPVKQPKDSIIPLTKIEDIAIKVQEKTPDEVLAKEVEVEKEVAAEVAAQVKELKWGEVTRLLLLREPEGLELIYLDTELRDTVRLFMPVAQMPGDATAQPKVIYKVEKKDTTAPALTITPTIVEPPVIKEEQAEEMKIKVEEKKVEEVKAESEVLSGKQEEVEAVAEEKKNDKKGERTPQIIYSPSVNANCSAYANNNDFLKIRKKIAAESDNDKMVDAARKFFKQKCYTTEQIKNLSYLFLDDEGKYKFFDAAYPYTSDSNMFYQLESQLQDQYYINRFRAMIQK